MAVFFNGNLLTTPTVASQVYDQGMLDQQPATGNTLAILGVSTGGVPTTPTWLHSIAEAREYLKGGPLLRGVEMAFAPSNETAGPQAIVAVRVNVATQASRHLVDSGSNNAILVESTDYGVDCNSIKVKVESGTNSGKKVSVAKGSTLLYVGDDLGYTYFNVIYTPSSTEKGYITIADNAGGTETTVTLETKTGTVYTTVATIHCTDYPTIQDLVNRINAETGFTATLYSSMGSYASVATMENTTALARVEISATGTTPDGSLDVTGYNQAIVDWMNGAGEELVDATRVAQSKLGAKTAGYAFLSGGTDGPAVTDQNWEDAIDTLETEDVQWIVPLVDDEDVWAYLSTHCAYMSTTGKRERRGFVGSSTGKTASDVKAYAAAINSDRIAFCYPGIYHYNDASIYANRSLTLYPAYYLAAVIAGGFSGINPGETMTNRTLNVMGLEEPSGSPVTAPGDTDQLIQYGICAAYKDPKSVTRVARACSTWLGDSRYNKVEISTGCAVDYTCREVRDKLQAFVGKKASPTTLQSVNAMVDSVLRTLATPEPIGLGILVGDTAHPAFKNISSAITGDVLRVTFECSPAIPINYILVSIHVTPYTSVTP